MEYTKAPIDILNMSIIEIQESVDLGLIDYETIAKIYLERIQEYNDEFNAIISVNENIVNQAKQLDIKYKESGRTSLLFGIPIVIKDNIDYVGMPTTAGAKGLSDNFPKQNAVVVQNLIDSGALIIAKANMSEFAFSASLSRSSYGTVKNAYDNTLTSYGSSGGTAVAVSTGMAVAGIGTDTNSSIRVPASAANLIGLRPTYGLFSSVGVINYDVTRDAVGVVTKYTSDNAIILDTTTNKSNDYTNYKDSITGMKIGVLTQFVDGDSNFSYISATQKTDEVILQLFNSTIEKLEDLGAEIIYIDDLYNNASYNRYNNTISGWSMCYFFNKYIKNTNSSIKSFSELVEKGGYIQELKEYEECCEDSIDKLKEYKTSNEQYKQYIESQMKKYNVDVLVYPTTKNKIPSINDASVISPSFTIAPVTGMPAISIPMGFDSNLPYGIEFVANENEENILYAISNKLVEEENFKLSSLTPNLYEIEPEVTELVDLYSEKCKQLNDKEYAGIKEEMQQFFDNYNEYDNHKVIATTLINKYNELELEITKNKQLQKENIIKISIIILAAILLYNFVKTKLKKKKKKRKNITKNKNKKTNTNKKRKNRQINRIKVTTQR